MAEARTPVVRRLGQDRAGTVAFGRFLGNGNVTVDEVFTAAGTACGLKAAGRRLLAIQDTTHLSFPGRPLGPGGDGKVPGLFLHPVLVVDRADGTAIGIAAGRVWTRAEEKVSDHKSRAFADRESERWVGCGEAAKAALAGAAHVTLIADRESDIYEEWVALPGPGFDLITRACSDRSLAGGGLLFAAAAGWSAAGEATIEIVARRDRVARKARLVLKFGEVTIRKPAACHTEGCPETVTLRLVEVEEAGAPANTAPVHWRLLTTLPVADAAAAWGIVEDYRRRWRIEEYFRILKRSGMDLEEARLEGAHALHNLVAIGAVAGLAVMQLVEGRDAAPTHLATAVIAPETLAFVIALCATLEGKTAKQKNPHARGSLAWLAWVVARLGGWSGYARYGKAGPKTIAAGWQIFNAMRQGWALRKDV